MTHKQGQPSLMGFLSSVPVSQVLRKRLFGKPFMRFPDFCRVLWFMYESGAILGRARCNQLDILEKMLLSSVEITGTGYDCVYFPAFRPKIQQVEFLRTLAKKRLDKFRNDCGKEPDTFLEFILFRELQEFPGGLGIHSPERYLSRKEQRALEERKTPIEVFGYDILGFGLEGIGFGGSFPELTERMYRNAYENVRFDLWSEARAHGLPLPERPTIVSLAEREETVLQMVAAYASEYYPELLSPLDLHLPSS